MNKILIIGAGPVGLTAAIELTRLGQCVTIIDKNTTHSHHSKAIGINPRSLVLLEPSGVSERLIEAGIPVYRSYLHYGKQKSVVIALDALPKPYNFLLCLPQDKTETILENTLNCMGVFVQRHREFCSLRQSADAVFVTFSQDNQKQEDIFDYVIGADGAHSRVRQCIHACLKGGNYHGDWHLADVHLTFPFEHQAAHGFILEQGQILAVLPLGDERFRLVSNTKNALILLPKDAFVKDILWESRFKIQHRITNKYQEGRVFLAGDAAHVHAPIGGRGMNLGIEDAATLAALIAQNKQSIYHQLRYSVGKKVVKETHRDYRLMTLTNKVGIFIRDQLLFRLFSIPFLQKHKMKNIAGMTRVDN